MFYLCWWNRFSINRSDWLNLRLRWCLWGCWCFCGCRLGLYFCCLCYCCLLSLLICSRFCFCLSCFVLFVWSCLFYWFLLRIEVCVGNAWVRVFICFFIWFWIDGFLDFFMTIIHCCLFSSFAWGCHVFAFIVFPLKGRCFSNPRCFWRRSELMLQSLALDSRGWRQRDVIPSEISGDVTLLIKLLNLFWYLSSKTGCISVWYLLMMCAYFLLVCSVCLVSAFLLSAM